MQSLKPLHLIVGVAGIVAFVLTGQYMGIFLKGLAEMPDGPRLLYRSAHLYLMWSSLLNLVVGFYFVTAASQGARVAQAIASAMLLAGPPLMLAAFFIESPINDLDRVLSHWANYFALAGTILHVVSSRNAGQALTQSDSESR
jgi:hypothetical protein